MRIENEGVGINVEVEGPEGAPPVLFMHGLSGNTGYSRWLPATITDGRRIIRMDLRGHGRSDRAPGTYVVERYADDAIAVLEQVAGGPAVLVGHSLGGSTAWTVAQRRPDLVAGVVLEDPPLYAGEAAEFPGSVAEVVFPIMRQKVIEWQAEGIDHDTWMARIGSGPSGALPSKTLGEEITPDALDARATSLSMLDPDTVLAASGLETLAGTDTVTPLTVPALLLRADAEMGPAIAPRHAERLAAEHPEVVVVEVKGAGHLISGSRAAQERFAELLGAFLDEHAPVAVGG